jgi:hypothetical protein
MFCAPGHIFGGAEGVGTCFHILRSRTRFRRSRGRRFPLSSFASPHSFSAVPRASAPIFLFCVPVHFFGGTEGVGSRFHVLRSRTHFRRFRGRRFLFSCFASLHTFSTVTRMTDPVFVFCAPRLIFGGTGGVGSCFHVLRSGHIFGGSEGVGSCFHVLRSRGRFRRYRGRQVRFSSFALPDSIFAVPRASCPIFMFCAPKLFFGSTKGVWSRFHVLRSRTRFRRCGGRRDPFSCFAIPDSFSAVPRASVPLFMLF